eukprot:CAMPEP_0174846144 /NCGR_PEP_ID=MMETSP1114-20130205/12151_1 /TAXON_ID=312471 /ORGANISM="Neobodo designis, Strain CCAP 1951/1" /LENGTH=575 /DNA_ID=CAMNT_0016080407 /DNA_START=87 /DNA_END=1814 /DNA_ORIENTATION=+
MHRPGGARGIRGRGGRVGPLALMLLLAGLIGLTVVNYAMLTGGAAGGRRTPPPEPEHAGHHHHHHHNASRVHHGAREHGTGDAPSHIHHGGHVPGRQSHPHSPGGSNGAAEEPPAAAPTTIAPAAVVVAGATGGAVDLPERFFATDPPATHLSGTSYEDALKLYESNMKVQLQGRDAKRNMVTDEYVDSPDCGNDGVRLPHDPERERTADWLACDPGNTTFSFDRDLVCARYLGDPNNMRAIKAQAAYLKNGRTLKFKIMYHHGNLTAIVKVSQRKFFYEAVSEYLAYQIDRALGISRVPPTAYVPLPIDFMKAASATVSPFYTQWFDLFIPNYDLTKDNLVAVDTVPTSHALWGKAASLVAIQVWMHDVHSALMGYLAVNYEQDDYFYKKFYDPEDAHKFPPTKKHRLQALGDLCDRFIFDFIIGNTDRGMNDHNNFAYGGCSERGTACHVPKEPWKRTKGPAKYAFIDHGSSFYSHREPEGSPFTGNETTRYPICRFRRSTYDTLKRFVRSDSDRKHHIRPLFDHVISHLPKRKFFNVVRKSVVKTIQDRLEKVVVLVDRCVAKHGADRVFVL